MFDRSFRVSDGFNMTIGINRLFMLIPVCCSGMLKFYISLVFNVAFFIISSINLTHRPENTTKPFTNSTYIEILAS